MSTTQSDVKRAGTPKRMRSAGSRCVWPCGVEERFGISAPTRWRWEKLGMLPPRDVFVAGRPVGWRPETLEAAERGRAG